MEHHHRIQHNVLESVMYHCLIRDWLRQMSLINVTIRRNKQQSPQLTSNMQKTQWSFDIWLRTYHHEQTDRHAHHKSQYSAHLPGQSDKCQGRYKQNLKSWYLWHRLAAFINSHTANRPAMLRQPASANMNAPKCYRCASWLLVDKLHKILKQF